MALPNKMALLNRIVNITVLVLSIIAVVFGYMLFQKREELVKRGDIMAAKIKKISTVLDTKSGTTYSTNIIPEAKKADLNLKKNSKAADFAKKTLSHLNYTNLNTVLAPLDKQASDIIDQRNFLGAAMKEIAEKLEIPETFAENQFQEIATYTEKKGQLVHLVEKVNSRDNEIVAQIVDSASKIGLSLDKDTLKNLENYKTPLTEFATKVEDLKKRSDKYADHITNICKIFGVNTPSLAGNDYSNELSTVEVAMQAVKKDLDDTKAELERTKTELAAKTEELNKAITRIDLQEKTIAGLKKKLDDLLNPDGEATDEKPQDVNAALLEKLEGKILEVNPKWDFVVIDLGKKNKLTIGTKQKREVEVELPEGKVMYVGRDNNFLAKIKIIRVNENNAIANILPENRTGDIEPGDKVFFAKAVKPAVVAGEAEAKAETKNETQKANKTEKTEKAE